MIREMREEKERKKKNVSKKTTTSTKYHPQYCHQHFNTGCHKDGAGQRERDEI